MLFLLTLTAEELQDRDRRIEEQIAAMAEGEISAMGELYALIKTDVYAYAL